MLASRWLRTVADSAAVAVMAVDREGQITFWNRAAERILGWRAEEVLGKPNPIVPEEEWPQFRRALNEALSGRSQRAGELERRRKDGAPVWIRLTNAPIPGPGGEALGVVAIAEDVTETVISRRRLERLQRVLRARAALAGAATRADGEQALYDAACRVMVEEAGYRMAWVGVATDDGDRTVRPVAWAGIEDRYLEGLRITWGDGETGRGPTGTAIRTGKVVASHNIQEDPLFGPWREDASRRGYRSSIALPLSVEGRMLGALNLYAAAPEAFDDQEVSSLAGLAQDLTAAVAAIRLRGAELALHESEARFRLAFETSPDSININRLRDGLYVDINEGFTAITGYTREDVLGRTSVEIQIWAHPKDREGLVAGLRRHGVVRNLEAEFRMKDGALRAGMMSAAVIDLAGEPHILSVTRDVTELVEARRLLRDHAERLEAQVAERTAELRRAVDLMAGREIRMAELKEAIRTLRRQLEEAGVEPAAGDPLLGEGP